MRPLGPGEDDDERYGSRFRITRIMEALARKSGDVEELIAVKSRDLGHARSFLEIAQVCAEAGRKDDALAWAERGMNAFAGQPDPALWGFVADAYHERGRHAEAMKVAWALFEAMPGFGRYHDLHAHAVRAKCWDEWRERALNLIRARSKADARQTRWGPPADRSSLVQIFLWEKNVDAAWHEANEGGCSESLWMELARRREKEHPEDALEVYKRWIGPTVARGHNQAYEDAVELLERCRRLLVRLGRAGEVAGFVAAIRRVRAQAQLREADRRSPLGCRRSSFSFSIPKETGPGRSGAQGPHMTAKKTVSEKNASSRIVVFSIKGRRESACDECGTELFPRSLIHLDEQRVARCMDCADLGHLIYLPTGDATLTRRATKHSGLSAVVVRWSTTRKRYERQGTLVEEEALRLAEEECLGDADRRAAQRSRAAEHRKRRDAQFIRSFARAIRERYPNPPVAAEQVIAEHACEKYSGRVGRSAAAHALAPEAVDFAVRAHVRHRWTRYDEHLMKGLDRDDARAAVRADVDQILLRWRGDA